MISCLLDGSQKVAYAPRGEASTDEMDGLVGACPGLEAFGF